MEIPPVYSALRNQLSRAQQNQEGDAGILFSATVYLFLAKYMISPFNLTEFFTTYVYTTGSGSKNPTELHIHDYILRSMYWYVSYQETANKQHRAHVTQHSLQTTQSTRDRPNQRAATKARSHQTGDRRMLV